MLNYGDKLTNEWFSKIKASLIFFKIKSSGKIFTIRTSLIILPILTETKAPK